MSWWADLWHWRRRRTELRALEQLRRALITEGERIPALVSIVGRIEVLVSENQFGKAAELVKQLRIAMQKENLLHQLEKQFDKTFEKTILKELRAEVREVK